MMQSNAVLPYQQRLKEYYRKQEKIWSFFSTAKQKEEQVEQFKQDLLRNSYKFDEASEPELFELFREAQSKLGLPHLKPAFYQMLHSDEVNASVIRMDETVHLVFSGQVVKWLNRQEMLAVIAHELSH